MESAQARIDQYLAEKQLTANVTKVLPLTGDASDRRYFRVLLRGSDSIVLALHAGAIDFEALPFVSVSRLMRAVPLPVPALLHHSNELGVIAQQDLGDVTLQAHLGAATADEHAALYRQAYGESETVAELIPFMLAGFLEGDRAFAKARKDGLSAAASTSEKP